MIRFLQTTGPIKKIVLGGLLLLICAAMLVYLIPSSGSSTLGTTQAGIIAEVGSEQVTRNDVEREAQSMLKRQFPRGNAMAGQLLPFFASQAAERLIDEKALVAEAKRMGLRATDDDVSDELQHGQYAGTFFPGGKFISQAQYEALLQNNEITVAQFEQSVKEQILFTKVRDLIAGSAAVSD